MCTKPRAFCKQNKAQMMTVNDQQIVIPSNMTHQEIGYVQNFTTHRTQKIGHHKNEYKSHFQIYIYIYIYIYNNYAQITGQSNIIYHIHNKLPVGCKCCGSLSHN